MACLVESAGFAADGVCAYHPRMTYEEGLREPVPVRRPRRLGKAIRRTVLILTLVAAAWLLLSQHLIVVTGDPALVVLRKTSWTFDGCLIGVGSWANFTLHHPILASRIAMGQGVWILGRPPRASLDRAYLA